MREVDARKAYRDAMSVASGAMSVANGAMSVASDPMSVATGVFGGAGLGPPRFIDFKVHHRSPSIISALI